MNKLETMYTFINQLEKKNKLTLLIINLFDYKDFHDYNYIPRLIKTETEVILDIYDNVSINRFNRYIFNFSPSPYTIKKKEENNVFITSIWIENVTNNHNKLLKFAYLFKTLDSEYAKTFLDLELVNILSSIIT